MGEADIKSTAQFVREYVTMGLIPWMEKAVVDWNENVGVTLYPFGWSILIRLSSLRIDDCQHGYSQPREVSFDPLRQALHLPPAPVLPRRRQLME